jgi:hypothetical protein
MFTRQSLPVFVLAIGGLILLGCGNQRQVPSNLAGAPNQTSSKIDPVADANVVAAAPGSPVIADVGSSGAQEHDTQFVMPNPRQHVLSSGFPARDY